MLGGMMMEKIAPGLGLCDAASQTATLVDKPPVAPGACLYSFLSWAIRRDQPQRLWQRLVWGITTNHRRALVLPRSADGGLGGAQRLEGISWKVSSSVHRSRVATVRRAARVSAPGLMMRRRPNRSSRHRWVWP